MKKVLYYLLVLVLVVAASFAVFFDDIVKNTVESYAHKSLNTPVEIAELRSDWSQHSVNIDFIEVKNPDNFSNDNAFVLNHLSASLSDETQGELIILDQLEFDGLLFTLEQNNNQVNLVELLKSLDRKTPGMHESIENTHPGKRSYRLKINKLSFINTQLFIDTQWLQETVEVPSVIIYNFGTDQGIPMAQVGAELMKLALTRIQSEAGKKGLKLSEKEIKEGIQRQLRGKLDDLKGDLDNKAKDWFKKIGL